MCLVTLGIWLLLSLLIVVTGLFSKSEGLTVFMGFTALILGVVLPVVANYWRPLFFGWQRSRINLHNRLMAEGVLTNEDLEKGARLVYMWEVSPGTQRQLPNTRQLAFLVIDGKELNVLGERTCFRSDSFRIVPGCTGRCSRCWVIWACGGDTFRLRVRLNDEDRDFLCQCREGRTLRQVARATEMLEELVEIDAGSGSDMTAGQPATPDAPTA